MPIISVVVTTYNRKELLSETINSILNQTFQDFEIIVVDNCSSYNFIEHIQSFNNDKLKPFQNANNGIIAVNRNYGLKQAKGEYVAFCDDDDIWLPNKLERQMDFAKSSSNVLIYSDMILFGENVKEERANRLLVKNINDLIKRNQIPYSSTFVTNSEILEFDEDPLLVASEDYALWLKLTGSGYKPIFCKDPLIRYRISNTSAFSKSLFLFHIKNLYTLVKHVLKNGSTGINALRYVHRINSELFYYFYFRSKKK